ncbi:MAG: tyrosine-type recombinase/integrase [Candidatus Bathyarchaeota archaeon]|nr:tyrosine-type recombinase/integrase [Candidatus Bathyarchaeota archaeon]
MSCWGVGHRLQVQTSKPLVCPRCGSSRAFKNGSRTLADGTKQQRYICRECMHRYTFEPNLNSEKDNVDNCRISAQMVKNLVAPSNEIELEGDAKLETFLWYMKKQGYSETTIASRGTRLKRLEKLSANLADPESVKDVIAKQEQWKPGMKEAVVFAYDLYAKYYGYKWERPRYKAVREIPFIPQEREIDDLIAGVNKEISLLLQIAKETGARAGEIYRLLWENIDFEAHTISITAEKNSNPRLCKMSRKLQNLLECQPTKTERVFNQYVSLNNLRRTFERQRKRLAAKLANPRLNKIKIHTLRHWKGTMEYHRTKDILHVMETLGHKSIKNTLLYTQLLKEDKPENYICKIARTPEEAAELIEAGFELHCEFGEHKEVKLFRKPK